MYNVSDINNLFDRCFPGTRVANIFLNRLKHAYTLIWFVQTRSKTNFKRTVYAYHKKCISFLLNVTCTCFVRTRLPITFVISTRFGKKIINSVQKHGNCFVAYTTFSFIILIFVCVVIFDRIVKKEEENQ